MSYCVNCGVELDNTAKKCALCNTPVVNPNIIAGLSEEEKPFSDKLIIPEAIKKRFLAFVVSVTMLIPNIVMFFLNVFFIRGNFWSIYVFSSCLLFWVVFVFPFFTIIFDELHNFQFSNSVRIFSFILIISKFLNAYSINFILS